LGTGRGLLALFALSENSAPSSKVYILPHPAVRCPGQLRLPGYVRGICSLLGSPRRSRSGGTTAFSILVQHDIPLRVLSTLRLPGLAYHNQRAEAANDQTPEDGGLVARGPVNVLAGGSPEGDRRHCGMCMCGGRVFEVSRKRCGRGLAGGGVAGALMLACLL
jgi:hypothetical protein